MKTKELMIYSLLAAVMYLHGPWAHAADKPMSYDPKVLVSVTKAVKKFAYSPMPELLIMPKFKEVKDVEKYLSLVIDANHDDHLMMKACYIIVVYGKHEKSESLNASLGRYITKSSELENLEMRKKRLNTVRLSFRVLSKREYIGKIQNKKHVIYAFSDSFVQKMLLKELVKSKDIEDQKLLKEYLEQKDKILVSPKSLKELGLGD